MNLHDKYKLLPDGKWKYYSGATPLDFDNFTHEKAYVFIRSTYKIGSKEKIFDVGFKDSFKVKGKHEHTAALYFLGCLFSGIVDEHLKQYLKIYVPDNFNWYDFRYTWFLTCLYHDTASVIEKDDWHCGCPSDLDFYLGKYDIRYNVFEQNWPNSIKPYTYSEKLVKDYFKYRVEHGHSIDHGIIGGYLLYDRLVKNYNEAWEKHSAIYPNDSYDFFHHKHLNWRKEHMPHFAIVADAIIAHNIWLSEDDDLYKAYGLDSLIVSPSNKLTIERNPLVFFLDLFDTIEPIKYYADVVPKVVLNEVDIACAQEQDHAIKISIRTNILNADGLYRKAKSMRDWLAVSVDLETDNTVKITINR